MKKKKMKKAFDCSLMLIEEDQNFFSNFKQKKSLYKLFIFRLKLSFFLPCLQFLFTQDIKIFRTFGLGLARVTSVGDKSPFQPLT